MSIVKEAAMWLPQASGTIMIAAGALNLRGSAATRASFARWGYPSWFHVPTGVLEVATGALLMVPASATIGAGGTILILGAAAATLLHAREWTHLPGAFGLLTAAASAVLVSQVTP